MRYIRSWWKQHRLIATSACRAQPIWVVAGQCKTQRCRADAWCLHSAIARSMALRVRWPVWPGGGHRRRRGGVVTQRIANPCTPVRFRPSPPSPSGAFRRCFPTAPAGRPPARRLPPRDASPLDAAVPHPCRGRRYGFGLSVAPGGDLISAQADRTGDAGQEQATVYMGVPTLNHYRLKPVGLQKGRLEVAFFKLCMLRMRFKHA